MLIQLGLLTSFVTLAQAETQPSRLAVIRQAPAFQLVDQDAKKVQSSDFRGKVLLVGFIFTTCNGTCPATTHRMAQVQDELGELGLLKSGNIHFVSITLDPKRDTPEALSRYINLYKLDTKTWSFLTGPPKQVAKAFTAWGMWAKPAANGQLDHPSRVFLVDRKGQVREIYNLAFFKTEWVVEDVRTLLGE